ncbi:uncharacterized protein [Panulirus ornatus]|uniref:uncharacterized protein n=1 Tax=Panulirus ornatus TaxID=150431 RepID=UPI003A8B3F23
MKTSLYLVAALAFLQLGAARVCYNCTGDCVRDTECKGSCTTSVPELGGNEVRSCIDEIEEAKCISENIGGERYKTCYCNTERCNSSSRAWASISLLMANLLLHLLR